MSSAYISSLLALPVEILYHILDYLDVSTTFLSFSNVCTHFRAISNAYNRCELELSSISKPDFRRICRFVQPKNVISLTLSDDYKTPGQIGLFLSLFSIHQFTRLHSLTLHEIGDDDLSKILHPDIIWTLTSLSIHWRQAHCPTDKTRALLSSILNRLSLHKLELTTESYAMEKMPWPVQNALQHLTLMYVTQKQYCVILRETPRLRTLVLNHFSMHNIDENAVTSFCPTLYQQLMSLTLNDSRLSMTGLTSILSLTPSLVYLKIICSPDPFDTIADGKRWEEFIRTNLPLLNKFEFFFTNVYNVYYKPRDVELLISRFRTPFWLEEKHCFVTCDYIDYLNQVMLYSTPLCGPDFTYECQSNKVSYSTANTMEDDAIIADNVRTINLTLTKLMAGTTTAKVSQILTLVRHILAS
jgi:hypothetical protein